MIPIWTHFMLCLSSCILLIKFAAFVKDFVALIGSSFIILWTSWQLTIVSRKKMAKHQVNPNNKAVVVTGCDSGFGHMLVQRLAQRGFVVFACCLFPGGEACRRLVTNGRNKVRIVALDVTDGDAVDKALESVRTSLRDNNEKLWALVNNAGVFMSGEIEWGKMDTIKSLLEVNVIGMVRVTRAFLPLIREDKGRVINMGSVAGQFCAPGFVYYSMSKHAVKSFTEGLRREMEKWDVPVIAIEPDAYKTPMSSEGYLLKTLDKCWEQTMNTVKEEYGFSYFDVFKRYVIANLASARNYPQEVVNALEAAVTSTEPQMKYLCCGPHNRLIIWMFDFLPKEWLELLVRFYIIRKRPAAYCKTVTSQRLSHKCSSSISPNGRSL